MNSIQTYYLLGNLLSADFETDRRELVINSLESPNLNWPLFIAIGSNHLVLQTIYCKLLEQKLTEYIPPEVLEHLKYIHDLNYRRNTEIMEQVISINTLLNDQGIVPLYLKGVGNIIDGLYTSIAERIMYDIDFLVPEGQWKTTAQILIKNGYQGNKGYDPCKRMMLKHYPTLSKIGAKASVEIHRLPVDFIFSTTLGAKEVWQNKKLMPVDLKCYVMSDRHKIVQNFIHSQLHHGGQLYAKVFLRNLYDLFLLSKRENPEEVFEGMNNYHRQAAGYLKIMNKGFGIGESQKQKLKHAGRLYLIRHEINLRTWVVSRSSYLVLKIFRAYIKLPFLSITDKALRASLIRRLLDINWYRQHLNSYRRIRINAGTSAHL